MGMEGEGSITERLVKRHGALYKKATRHPFILSISDGSIHLPNFKRWLAQDYLFVRSFIKFAASVLLKMPKDAAESDEDTILGGIAALHDEISWFRGEALKWEVSLENIVPSQANQKYLSFLEDLTAADTTYPIMITAYWAIEVVYNESFAACLESDSKTPPELLGACERWGSLTFHQYCVALQALADCSLKDAPVEIQRRAEEAFTQVLKNEVSFWNMSCEAD